MKYLFPALVFLVFSTMSAFSQTPAEKFVKTFSEKKNAWLIQKNYDSLKNMLDSRCLYIHSNGWAQTAEEVVQDIKSGKLVYQKITIKESNARQFEKMVIVNGKGKFSGKLNGNDFSFELVYTEVYVNRASGWKLVSRQSGRLN